MITRDDLLIAVSHSGSGQELLTILPVARRMGAGLVAITGNPASALVRLADLHRDTSVAQADWTRVVEGKSVSVRGTLGCRCVITKKNITQRHNTTTSSHHQRQKM